MLALLLTVGCGCAFGGGPRWAAGSTYFDPAAEGKPIVWKGGAVSYYTDLGALSATVDQNPANALVADAAAIWNSVPTAGVSIAAAGSLAEDVNGANIAATSGAAIGAASSPADIVSTATQRPLAIVYDYDGAVTDALLGAGASDPISCIGSGVTVTVDGMATDGAINHALMVINGRCATPDRMQLMQYLVTRAFGRVLGLDWSDANDIIFTDFSKDTPGAIQGWPLMHPIERLCNSAGGSCMPEALSLRPDDISALDRLYPVTAANLSAFQGKTPTAAATISIQGTIQFRMGQGMQGVSVVAQPLAPGTDQPDARYTATAVSGALFKGNAGNPVNGILDQQGNPLKPYGGSDPALEGAYDLSGLMLPPGLTQADYQISFEPINPLDTGAESVGPYALGQVTPSGTMPVVIVRGLHPGSAVVEDVAISDSDQELGAGADGAEASPANLSGNGEWLAKLDGYGHSSWFRWHIRAGRQMTIETQALDEGGRASGDKARPVLGIWNGWDVPATHPADPVLKTIQPFNGSQRGLTLIRVQTLSDADVRLGIADQRGDGRPDYLYRGRVLYADTVTPTHIGTAGGAFTIRGVGFRPQNQVTVNGVPAAVTGVTSTEISAIAPPAAAGVTGSVDLTVTDPATQGAAAILGGITYDATAANSLVIVTAPANTVAMDVPLAFTVRALAPDGVTAAGSLAVAYVVSGGNAVLGCGQPSCTLMSSADGFATVTVTANSTAAATVAASLANGVRVMAQFSGGVAPQIAAIGGKVYLAPGAVFPWNPQALVLLNGTPTAGQTVNWSAGSGVNVAAAATTSDPLGTATAQLAAGPLTPAATVQVNACLPGGIPGGPNCAEFTVASTSPAGLVAVSGAGQSLPANEVPAPVVLQVQDSAGHPTAGAAVNFYETLTAWQPPCPSHGRCPAAPVLGSQTAQEVSDVDGVVTLAPLAGPGTPTRLTVTAVIGSAPPLNFQIEQRP